jgi:hypothetical protein
MNIIYGRMVLSIGFSAKRPSICELVQNFNKDNGLDPYRSSRLHFGSDGGGTSRSLQQTVATKEMVVHDWFDGSQLSAIFRGRPISRGEDC